MTLLRRTIAIGAMVLAVGSCAKSSQSSQSSPSTTSASKSSAASSYKVPVVQHERYQLDNGLTVLLIPDKTSPVVAVSVWYAVGSADEAPGRTGFAHLFEHMMFQGSEHIPNGVHIATIENSGGSMNGSTSNDRTNYYETMPAHHLETALWLESDRMGNLLPAVDQRKLDAQRDVVKNERRQRVDNVPFGSQYEVVAKAIYPATNPYSWPVIGSMADLSAATLEDVKGFFRKHYAPGNATIAISGGFDVAETKALIKKYFGSIPKGPAVESRQKLPPVTLGEEKRLVLEDVKATTPQFTIVWPSVGASEPDNSALEALGMVLTFDRTSRLQKLLVYDRQVAARVQAYQQGYLRSGQFGIGVIPRPAASLTEIERLVDSAIAAIATNPITQAELDRFQNYVRVSSVLSMDGAARKGEMLLEGQVFYKDPLHYVKEIERTLALKPADLNAAAKKYFTKGRVVLSMVPAGKLDLVAKPDAPYTNVTPKAEAVAAAAPKSTEPTGDTAILKPQAPPKPAAPKPLSFPPAVIRNLKNGTQVAVLEDHTQPVIAVFPLIEIPSWTAPVGKEGIISIVDQMLSEGTKNRTADQLADEVAKLGNDVGLNGFYTIKQNADASLDILADILRNPSFPSEAFERTKANMLTQLQARKADPRYAMSRGFSEALYGADHPYSRNASEESIKGLTEADIKQFYDSYYRPPNITFMVAGDITPDEAVAKLEKYFGDWAAGTKAGGDVPEPKPIAKTTIYIVDKPGTPQSVIQIGHMGPIRDIPDFFALQLAADVFGGAFNSRLNLELRERRHYSYGAGSRLTFRKPPELSTFSAGASVSTPTTDSSVAVSVREYKALISTNPPTAAELDLVKAGAISSLPLQFEQLYGRIMAVLGLVSEGLPLDYYSSIVPKVTALTPNDLAAAAKKYFKPDNMVIVVVGDRKVIEEKLKALNIAPVEILTIKGL